MAKNVERKDSLLRGRLLEGFFYFPPAFFLPFYIFPLEYPFDVDDVGVVVGFGLLTFYWSLTHFKNGAVTNGGITMLFVAKKKDEKKRNKKENGNYIIQRQRKLCMIIFAVYYGKCTITDDVSSVSVF